MKIKTCEQCGVEFKAPHGLTKFCGKKCADARALQRHRNYYRKGEQESKYKRKALRTFECVMCGAEKTTNRENGIYCGQSCKRKAETERRKDLVFRLSRLQAMPIPNAESWGYATRAAHKAASTHKCYTQKATSEWFGMAVAFSEFDEE